LFVFLWEIFSYLFLCIKIKNTQIKLGIKKISLFTLKQ